MPGHRFGCFSASFPSIGDLLTFPTVAREGGMYTGRRQTMKAFVPDIPVVKM